MIDLDTTADLFLNDNELFYTLNYNTQFKSIKYFIKNRLLYLPHTLNVHLGYFVSYISYRIILKTFSDNSTVLYINKENTNYYKKDIENIKDLEIELINEIKRLYKINTLKTQTNV